MTLKIGVLLIAKENDEQVGVFEFDPSGMLISRIIKRGMNAYALKPLLDLMSEPLYQKHAAVIEEMGNLPEKVLYKEAEAFAGKINEAGIEVSGISVKATVVYWEEPTEEEAE